ncbi:hypothetical protein M413DRAFT_446536 [Hebeloma cylindrosporum]|uniref:Uncharacterized protein n=1 Tax=Hebeloma cylindrosporum TaxID=76867 RepID=A0A0C3C7Z8_HEBCY|nr:hypothetical protein M413DRAFT_446536 [Hebeloma cylindrosporum h7]
MLGVAEAERISNETPRINRLPLEIFVLIFQLVQMHPTVNSFPPISLSYSEGNINSWLKILWICYEWRRVALATPSLWKNILTCDTVKDHEDFAQWSLHNSGRLVLLSWTINLNQVILEDDDDNRQLSPKFLDLFASNLHRIESLSIQCPIGQTDRSHGRLFELAARPMPMLQALDVQLPSSNNFRFPATLGLSAIKHLSIRSQTLPRITFRQLSHLSLEQQKLRLRPSLKLFLDFLKANPALQTLRLKDAGPVLSMGDLENLGYPPGIIELRHLHRVQYEISRTDAMAHSGAFYWLLACLNLPEDATIYLASPGIPAALRRSKQMYGALAQYFNRISSVKLAKANAPGLLFHGTRLYVEAPLDTTFFHAKRGPYSHVQTLILAECTNQLSPNQLQSILKSFSGLQRIEVEWAPSSGDILRSQHPVIRALSNVNTRNKKGLKVATLPCRGLQALVLKCTSFRRVCPEDWESHEDAKYYRADGKIRRENRLGLYSLEEDCLVGPLPPDRSFAGRRDNKFGRALRSGNFRYL